MIKAVIFDMDGVIIDSEGEYLKYMYAFAREKRPDIRIEELYGTVGTTKKDCWDVMEKALKTGETWEELREQYHSRGIWKRAFEEVDYRAIFRPEILPVMDQLREMGLKLAVASSTREETVRRHLRAAGIEGRFAAVVCGDMVTHSKPHPEIYELACARLGKTPPSCAALEDSRNGLRSAHAAGCRAVMVPDLWQSDPETEAFLAAKGETLDQLIPWFAAHIKKEG